MHCNLDEPCGLYVADTHPDAPVDSFEYYEKLSLELSACFHEAETKLSGIDPEEFEDIYGHLLKWTNLQDVSLLQPGKMLHDTDEFHHLSFFLCDFLFL